VALVDFKLKCGDPDGLALFEHSRRRIVDEKSELSPQ